MLLVHPNSILGDGVSPVLNEVVLFLKMQVHRLGMILVPEPMQLIDTHATAVVRNTLYQLPPYLDGNDVAQETHYLLTLQA